MVPHDVCSPLLQQLINSTCSTAAVFLVAFGWRALTLEHFDGDPRAAGETHLQDPEGNVSES